MLVRLKNRILRITSRIMSKRFKEDNIASATDVVRSKMFTRLASPTKSQSDVKEYSVIKLVNGLTALLISDKSQILSLDELINHDSESESGGSSEETSCSSEESEMDAEDNTPKKTSGCEEKLAACALCIGVGSFSDPENIPGLAHFLEHMIFMGSEKYPKENEFDVFIKKKGGSDNASTECEYTTFYFDCHEAYLHGAMEIFSHLFISPLMKRESMTKEREAIESEFQMSLPSDDSRKSQLLCSLADKMNPAHKFMWGNLITLRDNVNDNELYKAVHEFRQMHYSAGRMTLAVQARLPIETLEQWVIECFQTIPNSGIPRDEFFLKVPPFKLDKFPKLYIVEPVKNINNLDFTWVMPSTLKMYKSKPLHYMSWVIGHEGKGSLLSYLREKLWCFGITVSSGGDGTEENSIYTLFTISLVLSQEGMDHLEDIVISVFEYIRMFQHIGPEERLFNEIRSIAETSFRFSEEVSSADNVEQLSENMHFYPSTDYITGMELYMEYNPQLIMSFLNELKTNNVNIMISSKVMSSTENLDEVEPWFGTRYTSKEIPQNWITNRLTTRPTIFHLPEENPFIASDFTILKTSENPDIFPKNILKDNMMEIWYKQDVTFKLPHGFCCLHFISPLAYISAQNAAMLDLFISLLKQSLSTELYPANVAQLEYNFYSGEKGLIIILHGYNQKIKVLLQAIINGIVLMKNDVKHEMVMAIKEELERSYSNSNLKTSFLSRDIRMSILLETFWSALEKKNALKYVTCEMLKSFICHYFEYLFVQCLVQGNISKDEAMEFGDLVKNTLLYKPILDNNVPQIIVNQLPPGEKYCVVYSFNEGDANSVVTNYYQSGLGSIEESCIIELLLMIMEEPIFDSLRTKQQLGYDVSCSLRDTFGILGFSISVHCQSDRNSVKLVETRITEFLYDFLQTLKETSQEDFREIQESLVKLKMCADIHLKEEVKRNWNEIKSEEYVFDRHLKEKEHIEKLTLETITHWFEVNAGIAEPAVAKKLSTQVVGKLISKDKTEISEDVHNIAVKNYELNFVPHHEKSDKFIECIKTFKNSLPVYPPHKIL